MSGLEEWLRVALICLSTVLRWGGAMMIVLFAMPLIFSWHLLLPTELLCLGLLMGVFAVYCGFAWQPGLGAASGLRQGLRQITQPVAPPAEYIYLKYLKVAGWCKSAAGILWTVRAEALILVLFAAVVYWPDQSAEAIRIMADPEDQGYRILLRFAGWLGMCVLLCFVLISSGLIALRRAAASADTEGSEESAGDTLAHAAEGDGEAGAGVTGAPPETAATRAPPTGPEQVCMIELRSRRRRAYIVAALSALPLGVAALALFTAAEAPGNTTELETSLHTHLTALDLNLQIAGWVFVIAFIFFGLGFFGSLQKELGRKVERAPNDPWKVLQGARSWATLFAVPVVFSTLGIVEEHLVAPAVILITAWAILLGAWILAPLIHYGQRWHIPFLGLLIVSAFLWGWLDVNDNHEIRTIGERFPTQPPSIDAAFGEWLAARKDRAEFGKQPYPVFLVAAEGGGLRAAYFTALVLDKLQASCAAFAQHTFFISGVSGGSVGAALFAENLRHNGARNEPKLRCSTEANPPPADAIVPPTTEALRADLLSPLLTGTLFLDLPQRFVPPRINRFDRARFLEDALSRAWVEATGYRGLDDVPFYDVWQGAEGAVPALILNTTNVETGYRMVVSHLSFPGPRTDLPTLFDINPALNIPLSTAAILSARFPLITPAGTMPVASAVPPKARYVDGGYFENSGLATILDAVEAMRQKTAKESVRLVIISIETSAATTNYANTEADDPSYPGFKFGELLSPLRALLNTRQARGELAKLETERMVKRLRERCELPEEHVRTGCVEAEVVTFAIGRGNVPVPLGWALSTSARRELEDQLGSPRQCSGTDDESNGCALFRVLQHVARE